MDKILTIAILLVLCISDEIVGGQDDGGYVMSEKARKTMEYLEEKNRMRFYPGGTRGTRKPTPPPFCNYNWAPTAELVTPVDFIAKTIEKQNEKRAIHGACPLIFNQRLSEISQAYANKLIAKLKITKNIRGIEHSEHAKNLGTVGENIYAADHVPKKEGFDPSRAVNTFYNEIEFWNFSIPATTTMLDKAGHFSQMIWKDSRLIGVALAFEEFQHGYSTRRRFVVVCSYSPLGNIAMVETAARNIGKPGDPVPNKTECAKSIPKYCNLEYPPGTKRIPALRAPAPAPDETRQGVMSPKTAETEMSSNTTKSGSSKLASPPGCWEFLIVHFANLLSYFLFVSMVLRNF